MDIEDSLEGIAELVVILVIICLPVILVQRVLLGIRDMIIGLLYSIGGIFRFRRVLMDAVRRYRRVLKERYGRKRLGQVLRLRSDGNRKKTREVVNSNTIAGAHKHGDINRHKQNIRSQRLDPEKLSAALHEYKTKQYLTGISPTMLEHILTPPQGAANTQTKTTTTEPDPDRHIFRMMLLGLDLAKGYNCFFTIDEPPNTTTNLDFTWEFDFYPHFQLTSLLKTILLCPATHTSILDDTLVEDREMSITRKFNILHKKGYKPPSLVILGPHPKVGTTHQEMPKPKTDIRKSIEIKKIHILAAWTLLLATLNTIAANRRLHSHIPDQILYHALPEGMDVPEGVNVPENIKRCLHGGITFPGVGNPNQVVLRFTTHWADEVVGEWYEGLGRGGVVRGAVKRVLTLGGRIKRRERGGESEFWEDKLPGWVVLPRLFWEEDREVVLDHFAAD